ncbi:sensor histidine kinase [Agromyces silvae]|uniref:sensor histidine kinase n=1 Tax=Agromyces silvae TaxID=3388266 RepID=UPI00280C2116|nr:sensor histidine kinase [Agromyces protaetiae]
MSIEAELREEYDRWERREITYIKALPYVLLAISTLITLLQPLWGGPQVIAAALGLTLAMTVWLVGLYTLSPKWHRNAPLMGLYYIGLMVLSAALVVTAPWYGIFAFVGYPHAFLFLRSGWRYVGVAATSAIMSISYVGGIDRIDDDGWWLWAAISVVSTALAAAFFRSATVSDQHSGKQREALAALHQANVKLEAALEENAGLHAQLLVQAREAGVLDERQRMAREIHDTLAQSLAGILTQLQAAEQVLDDPSAARRHVTTALGLARESLIEARRTVHAVEPHALAEAKLPDAIGEVTRRWSAAHEIPASLTTTGDPRPLHAEVEVTLFRAAQEALNNVAKHAHADRVGLTLSYMDDLVTLDIRDDGVGFEPAAARRTPGGGFGLAGMRQRVQRLAGRLDIESEPGAGTAISATVPAIPAGGAQ